MPTNPKHHVRLTKTERTFLNEQTRSGNWTPRQVTRAKILILADIDGPDCLLDEEICEHLGCSLSTVSKRRKRFAETRSVEDTIFDKARPGRPTIVDGAVDAHMTSIACSEAPEGRSRWTLRLIKDRLVTLEVIDEISHTTVARALKKKKSNLG
jgi:transposase